jgi:uncharacterized protein (TIGR00255 family)
MKSMTGFGSSEGNGYKMEIRTVNHRFCEASVKMPANLAPLEKEMIKIIQDRLQRGRIEVSITQLNHDNIKMDIFKVNKKLATAYLKVLKDMSREFNLRHDVCVEYIAKVPGIIQQQEGAVDLRREWTGLKKLLLAAITKVNSTREKEAVALKKDFVKRIRMVEITAGEIKKLAPLVADNYQKNLESRLKKMLNNNVQFDQKQILNETAVFAERSDITEEIVRLESHLKQFKAHLDKNIAIGRILDFILQEMNREVNTIGSKANDYNISQKVVMIKNELEKIREQAQNIL